MEPKLSADGWKLTSVAVHQTERLSARSIPYGSYSEGTAVRALIILGLTLFCGLSLLAIFAIV